MVVKYGTERQLLALSRLGLVSKFVGQLTDSRSFLLFIRHEHFRRILCEYLVKLIENDEYSCDLEILGNIVEDICYNNAKKYFEK